MSLNQRIITGTLALSLAILPAVSLAHETGKEHGHDKATSTAKQKIEFKKAQIASSTEAKKAELKDKKAQIASSTQAKRDEMKSKITAKWQKQAEEQLDRVITRLNAAFDRVSAHISRVEAFVTKNTDKLANKSAIQAKLTEAKKAVTDGRADLTKLASTTEASLASSTPKAAFQEAKGTFKGTMGSVKTAHQKVVEAIRLIKANKGVNTSATSTATTTSN
ncbi:MAG TPA: hypothetical protein VEB60_02505 [Candidatus Paceibacterota bacterium]|nr:hypothetical protein [Candidatus Paceibacterota bacterium]